jgi:hypothetical protein
MTLASSTAICILTVCSAGESSKVSRAVQQGLTFVHYSAQLKPFLTKKHTLNTPNIPYHLLNTPETTPNSNPCDTDGAFVVLKSGRV